MTVTANTPARVVVLLTSTVVVLILLLAIGVRAAADDPTAGAGATVPYVVQTGDTLWEIAADHTDTGDDVRDLVHDIRAVNELDSSVIVAGTTLRIPIDW